MKVIVSPSVLSADFGNLQRDVEMLNRSEAEWIHIDVMDGVFVPNISFGFPLLSAIRKHTTKICDVHLMIEEPSKYAADFKLAGADHLIVHYEACPHLHRTIELIHYHGMHAGVVLNPATRIEVLSDILPMLHHVLIMSVNPGFGGQKFIPHSIEKIRKLAAMRKELGLAFRIEVDGGIAHDTVAQVVQAGAELLVAGNAVFGSGNAEQNARELLADARKAAGELS